MKPTTVRVVSAVMGAVALTLTLPTVARAQNVRRLSAQFFQFSGNETQASSSDTVSADNGVKIYDHTVKVPAGNNVLYVTLSGTGDVNGANVASWFTCLVDGNFCNSGVTFATSTAGWIALQGGSNTQHDNNINYTWCTPITKGNHEITLRMASNGGGTVFIEAAHFFIDVSKVADKNAACTGS